MLKSFYGKFPKIPKSCYVSESVDIIGDVTFGENVNVWFGTVIRGDMNYIKVDDNSNIQDNSVIHVTTNVSPTIIGKGVTVGHNAIVHGAKINDFCLIGMGSIIMDEVIIGEGSIIAAGCVIPQKMIIPPRSLVIGLPAKIKRKTTNEEYMMIIERSNHYIDFAKKYKG
mgnify:CR=1 FL=1